MEENHLTSSWPNFSQIGRRAADLELKTYAQFIEIFFPRKIAKCMFGGVLPVKGLRRLSVKVDEHQKGSSYYNNRYMTGNIQQAI